MSEKARAVLAAAAALTYTERVELIKALLLETDDGAEDDPEDVAAAWRDEIQRRSLEVRSGAVRPLPLDEVLDEGERVLRAQD